MKKRIRGFAFTLLGLLYGLMELMAQSPAGIDTRSKTPKPFTLDDILLYIVFPLLLVIVALYARRRQKKDREKGNTSEQ
jgi:hypothetical protein